MGSQLGSKGAEGMKMPLPAAFMQQQGTAVQEKNCGNKMGVSHVKAMGSTGN